MRVGGHRLEVERLPGGQSAELVFLHEGLGSVSTWRDFPGRLAVASGRGAVVYSRWGHGRAEILREPRHPDFMHREAETLAELLALLGCATPVLVGHSDGGSIALLHAALHGGAHRPSALVLLAPHVFVEERTLQAIAAARDALATSDLALRLGRHHDDPLRTFRGWNDVWLDPRFRAWDIRAVLGEIACPILVIQGEDDPYGSMAQLDELERHLGPGAPLTQLRLPACGHSPHREREEEVIAAIARFLAALPHPDPSLRSG